MKLLTAIAAFLLSFYAFSQELIEYNPGTFSRNGEEMSREQIEKLTKYKGGWYAKWLLKQGTRADWRANNKPYRYSVAVLAAGMGGAISASCFLYGDLAKEAFDLREVQMSLYGLGVATIPPTVYASYKLSKPSYWLNQRDKFFTRLAKKLNQAAPAL